MKFIINVRENCKVSHTAMEQIIDGIINLFEDYSSIILVSLLSIIQIFVLLLMLIYN